MPRHKNTQLNSNAYRSAGIIEARATRRYEEAFKLKKQFQEVDRVVRNIIGPGRFKHAFPK